MCTFCNLQCIVCNETACTARQWGMKGKENVYRKTVGHEGKGECVQRESEA